MLTNYGLNRLAVVPNMFLIVCTIDKCAQTTQLEMLRHLANQSPLKKGQYPFTLSTKNRQYFHQNLQNDSWKKMAVCRRSFVMQWREIQWFAYSPIRFNDPTKSSLCFLKMITSSFSKNCHSDIIGVLTGAFLYHVMNTITNVYLACIATFTSFTLPLLITKFKIISMNAELITFI